ncbi:hypothetical protein Tco_1510457 [Tanacetum coccineum]
MAAYQVPPSPDYIPGPEVPPSPDYIPGPEVPPSPDYIPGPEVPPSPDYIPGTEEPQSPPPLDFVPEPMYPEYMPQEDVILPAEEQPLPTAASPTSDLLGYVPETDPEEDDEDPEEDPADYPADRDDDDDDDEDEDEDEEEEEELPAPANSVPPIHRMTARISIQDEPSISLPHREEVERLLALTTPPPSPLTPLSSPLPQIPSSPLPIPSPPPNSPTHTEIPESCLPLRKRVRFASPTLSHEVGESSVAGATKVDVPPGHSMFREDRPVHRRLAVMIEREAKMAREDWGLSMDASDYACLDVMSLRTTVVAQSGLISELQSADHRRQMVISELLASDHKRQVQLAKTLRLLKGLQTQMVKF